MGKILCKIFAFVLMASSVKAQLVFPNVYVQYDSVWQFKNLQLIPVKFAGNAIPENKKTLPSNIISLQQAIEQNKVIVKEIKFDKGADVSVLVIKNNSGKNILINSGQLITGGKQDRVVAETKFITPQKDEQYISVFCAEKGRWDDKPQPFYYGGSVDISLRKKIDTDKRQQQIWKEIEQQFYASNEKSATFPYRKLIKKMEKTDTAYINYFTKKYQSSDSSFAGFIAIAGNKIIACEVFALPYYTNLFFKEILSGFVHGINKNAGVPSVSKKELNTFIDSLFATEASQKQFLQLHGRADKLQSKTLHIIAYGN